MSETIRTVRPAANPQMQKPRHFRGIRFNSEDYSLSQLPGQGPNDCEISRGNRPVDDQGGTESGTLSGKLLISDARLVKLIAVWPALADDVKGEVLTLAGLPDDVDDFNEVTTGELPLDGFGGL